MQRNGLKGAFLQPLSPHEIDRIDQSALEVLANVGILVDHPAIRSLLEQKGCQVEATGGLVKFPPALVQELVACAPHQVTLCGRDSRHDLKLGTGQVYARVPGGAPGMFDLDTGEWRTPTRQDVADIARVTDALDHISGVSVFPVVPMDVPIEMVDLYAAQDALSNTGKHLFYVCHNISLIEHVIDMAAAAAGDAETLAARPLISALVEGSAPLRLMEEQLQVLLAFINHGLPAMLHSHPIAGLTSPVTLAGELVITHAEVLALAAIAQSVRPGTPVIYGMSSSVPDMRSAINLSGAVEIGLLGACVAQLSHQRGLPCSMSTGTDSKLADAQASMERLLTMLPPILSGIDMLNITTTNTKLAFCLELLAIDEQILAEVERYLQGVRVDDETLALDTIAQVGPGGSFILDRHTRKHHRQELMTGKLLSRETREDWQAAGSPDMRERARQTVHEILNTHTPLPLSDTARARMASIVHEIARD